MRLVSIIFYLFQLAYHTSRHLYTSLCVATLTRPFDESSASVKTFFHSTEPYEIIVSEMGMLKATMSCSCRLGVLVTVKVNYF